jgi:hypothetical protein
MYMGSSDIRDEAPPNIWSSPTDSFRRTSATCHGIAHARFSYRAAPPPVRTLHHVCRRLGGGSQRRDVRESLVGRAAVDAYMVAPHGEERPRAHVTAVHHV